MKLLCKNYRVSREANAVAEVDVRFILVERDNMPEALAAIERYLSGEVVLVKAQDKPRCYYCGTLAQDDESICKQCGAPL